jgi:hypothetical protein
MKGFRTTGETWKAGVSKGRGGTGAEGWKREVEDEGQRERDLVSTYDSDCHQSKFNHQSGSDITSRCAIREQL